MVRTIFDFWTSLAAPALAAVLLLGCGDPAPPAGQTEDRDVSAVEDAPSPRKKVWLDVDDTTDPAWWLASRVAGKDLDETMSPEVSQMRALLDEARTHFGESARMIANRAVQLEGTLKSAGVDENAPDLIARFTEATGRVGETEGFGAMCHHYYNLRSKGVERSVALSDLSARYGGRTPVKTEE